MKDEKICWAVALLHEGKILLGTQEEEHRMSLDQSAAVAIVYFEGVHPRTITFCIKE